MWSSAASGIRGTATIVLSKRVVHSRTIYRESNIEKVHHLYNSQIEHSEWTKGGFCSRETVMMKLRATGLVFTMKGFFLETVLIFDRVETQEFILRPWRPYVLGEVVTPDGP